MTDKASKLNKARSDKDLSHLDLRGVRSVKGASKDKFIVAGVDLLKEAERYWAVLCKSPHTAGSVKWWDRRREMKERGFPALTVRKCKIFLSGTCYGNRIVLRFNPPDCDEASVKELLLHELCHAAMGNGVGHKMTFRRCLRDAAEELWGIQVPDIPKTPQYGIDDLIEEQLREKLGLPWKPYRYLPNEIVSTPFYARAILENMNEQV